MDKELPKTYEGWLAYCRADVARRAKKPLLTDRQRAQIAADGWRELGYTVYIDQDTNQVFGFPNADEIPKPALKPSPLPWEDPEKGLNNLHRVNSQYRGQFAQMSFLKEVRRDTDADRREFLKRIGALTPAERKVKLRQVLAPWVWEVYDQLGITEILMNSKMSQDVVSQMTERLKLAEKIVKNPEFIKRDEGRRREFKYWLFLKRLDQNRH